MGRNGTRYKSGITSQSREPNLPDVFTDL